jgi:hypothetical protein
MITLLTSILQYKDLLIVSSNEMFGFTNLINTFYPYGDFIGASIFLYLLCLYILVIILIFNLIFFDKIKINDSRNSKASRILYLIYIIFQKILICPIFITLFSFMQNDPTGNYFLNFKNIRISDTISIINFTLSILVLILYIGMLIFNLIFFNDSTPNSKVPWASPYNYVDIFHFLLKIFICLIFVFDIGSFKFGARIAIFILLIILCLVRLLFPIFFNIYSFITTSFFEGIYLTSSVFSILYYSNIIEYSFNTIIIQIVLGCFVGFLYLLCLRALHFYFLNIKVRYVVIILDIRSNK